MRLRMLSLKKMRLFLRSSQSIKLKFQSIGIITILVVFGVLTTNNSFDIFMYNIIEKYGQVVSNYMDQNYKKFKDTQFLIENLGYRELSVEDYESRLNSMDEELAKQAQEQQ